MSATTVEYRVIARPPDEGRWTQQAGPTRDARKALAFFMEWTASGAYRKVMFQQRPTPEGEWKTTKISPG